MLEIYGNLPYCLILENCHVSHEFVSFFPGMMRVPRRGLRPSGLYCEGPGLASDMLAKNSLIFSETSTNMIIAVNGNQSNQVAHQHVN